MKLIVGLGNPGIQYEHTRHNVGFFMIDRLREYLGGTLWTDSRFSGLLSEVMYQGEKVILLKPMTYMNLSGESVVKVVNFYKLNPKEDVLILVDDIDMDFGKLRTRSQGSSGGQNGLKSLIDRLGTDEFTRIKIGIGRDPRYEVADWVLSRFKKEEWEILESDIFPNVLNRIQQFIHHT